MPEPEGLAALGSELLGRLGTLPEQTNAKLRKELNPRARSSRCRVKREDLGRLVEGWIRGDPYERMFADLPSVQRSTIKPKVDRWMQGVNEPSSWDAEFDQFVEIVRAAVERFLSWLAHACGSFSPLAGGWTTGWDWNSAAELFESGVDTLWAAHAGRLGAPAGRVALAPIGRAWPESFTTTNDPLGLAALRDATSKTQIEQAFRDAIDTAGRSHWLPPQEFARLRAWLWQRAGLPVSALE